MIVRLLGMTCLAALALSMGGLAGAREQTNGERSGASAPFSAATRTLAAPGAASHESMRRPVTRLVDLNAASRADLMTLPGIGDPEAGRIVKGRPYKSKTDLVTKKVLDLAVYDQLSQLVVVEHRRVTARPKPASSSATPEGSKRGS